MRRIASFPRTVREIENCWIPLSDGCRLAARVWLPEDTAAQPVPAVLEIIPYRKRDRTRRRDEPVHRYFAGHGYAALRIDVRGSGDSDGLLADEYSERELADAVEAIRWTASQTWCSGAVGMIGKSWGAFVALQVAALRPPGLRAVIAVCGSDDRYGDDAHYMGGCLLNENLIWGSTLLTFNAFPPDPLVVGGRWRQMWIERMRNAPLFPALWLEHQRRDAYWRRGSVCEDYSAIACPVFAVSGWADGYSNAVPRLLAGLSAPAVGWVGPWGHQYPHNGSPGPAIGFLQEALSFWDRWLLGIEARGAGEPAFRAWMQAGGAGGREGDLRRGRWVAESSWPSERVSVRTFGLRRDRLVETGVEGGAAGDADPEPLSIRSPQTTGHSAGSWCGFGYAGEHAGDQRLDDASSLCFDSPPLREPLELLGAPCLRLAFAADRPLGFVAVRLNELRPDGSSWRTSYGLLNLAHREGHARPEPLEAGRAYEARVVLNDLAHSFPTGHRLRLALSTAYWPLVWPSPEPVTLTVIAARCRLELPVRPPSAADAKLRPFAPPESAPIPEVVEIEPTRCWRLLEAQPDGSLLHRVLTDVNDDGGPALERLPAVDLLHGHSVEERFHIHPDDPASARAELVHHAVFRRGDWSTRIRTWTQLSSTQSEFVLEASLRAWEGESEAHARSWELRVPRDHV